MILRVRLALPKAWKPELGYLDLERKMMETGNHSPDARTLFDWVCAIRRAKLPDPAQIGNAGSFFKNPVVSADVHARLAALHPGLPRYPQPDGSVKLAAGWLIEHALAAEVRDRHVEATVALGVDDDELDLDARVGGLDHPPDVAGLPDGQRAAARGGSDDWHARATRGRRGRRAGGWRRPGARRWRSRPCP